MTKLLILPGLLFLLVILFRVIIPYISTAPWKRLLDSALYHRHRKEFGKSDRLLEKAVAVYPDRSEVYLDYFLNHSDSRNIKKRFEVLFDGYQKTGDVVLGFFIGSTYLEHGMYENAEKILDTQECRKYMLKRGITLLPELYYEMGDYSRADEEFIDFYSELYDSKNEPIGFFPEMGPQELIMYALIKKAAGEDYKTIMDFAPKTSVHSDMSWHDLLFALQDKEKKIDPAVTGISGDPGTFNRKRKEYFQNRIKLIESYL